MSFVPTPYSAAGPAPMANPAAQPINPRLLLLHQFLSGIGHPANPHFGYEQPGHTQIQHVMDVHNMANQLAQIVSRSRGPKQNRFLRPDTAQNSRNLPIARPEGASSQAAHAAAIQMAREMAARIAGGPHFPGNPGIYQIPNAPVGRQPIPNPNYVF